MKKDFLIIGQGLAGSFLAWNLLKRGKTVVIVDDNHNNCASLTAAGMVNPITGKRLVLSQRCEELLPYAKNIYNELEQLFNEKIFESKDIIRLFRDDTELNEWEKKRGQTHLKKYYGKKQKSGIYGNKINDKLGSFIIKEGGYCRKLKLIECFINYFKSLNIIINQKFVDSDLLIKENCFKFNGDEFEKVIFCEGYQSIKNKWFNWLPFNLAKGEILTLETSDKGLPDAVISCGKWCIPVSSGVYYVGSTYSWDKLDCETTETGKLEILGQINKFVKVSFKVVGQSSGVRPIMIDLKPVMGEHPNLRNMFIFNGLASKGLIWGPFYSNQMAEFLINKISLEKDVDISRFIKKYFNK